MPVAVAALAFRVAALIAAAGTLARKTVTFYLGGRRRNTSLSRHQEDDWFSAPTEQLLSLSTILIRKVLTDRNGERKPKEDVCNIQH